MADIQFSQRTFQPSLLSAFGTIETNELNPVIQGDFVYGLNSQIWNIPSVNTLVAGGATVSTSNSRLIIQGGTSSGNYAYITSRKVIKYRAGQGTTCRFTPIFTTGVANSIQQWGVGTIGTNNAPVDGYFVGYNGTSFGIFHYANNATPTFITQSSWNNDKLDGSAGTTFTLDPTKGCPLMIKYPFLGYGNIEFFYQNPTTGGWVLVHVIQYANTTNTAQLGNPSMQLIGLISNSANIASTMTMYCGSVGAFVSGQKSFETAPRWATDVNAKTVASTETYILSIKNATYYNGVLNRNNIRLDSFSIGTNTGNQQLTLRFIQNLTLTGTPIFVPISGTTSTNGATVSSGNSISSVDKVATYTANTGNYVYNCSVGLGATFHIDLTPFNLYIAPGETLTILGIGSGNVATGVSVNWREEI